MAIVGEVRLEHERNPLAHHTQGVDGVDERVGTRIASPSSICASRSLRVNPATLVMKETLNGASTRRAEPGRAVTEGE